MLSVFMDRTYSLAVHAPSVAAATEGGHYHCLLAGNDALKGVSNIKVKEQREKRRQDGPSC